MYHCCLFRVQFILFFTACLIMYNGHWLAQAGDGCVWVRFKAPVKLRGIG